MMERRHIAFGVCATSVAMRAISGRCRNADRLELCLALLDLAADDEEAREATVAFCRGSQTDVVAAGEDLREFVRFWRRHLPPVPEFEWQGRVDVNG